METGIPICNCVHNDPEFPTLCGHPGINIECSYRSCPELPIVELECRLADMPFSGPRAISSKPVLSGITRVSLPGRVSQLKAERAMALTCTTCDYFRRSRLDEGYCNHPEKITRFGCEQYVGSFHGTKHAISAGDCPVACSAINNK